MSVDKSFFSPHPDDDDYNTLYERSVLSFGNEPCVIALEGKKITFYHIQRRRRRRTMQRTR